MGLIQQNVTPWCSCLQSPCFMRETRAERATGDRVASVGRTAKELFRLHISVATQIYFIALLLGSKKKLASTNARRTRVVCSFFYILSIVVAEDDYDSSLKLKNSKGRVLLGALATDFLVSLFHAKERKRQPRLPT